MNLSTHQLPSGKYGVEASTTNLEISRDYRTEHSKISIHPSKFNNTNILQRLMQEQATPMSKGGAIG